VRLSRNEISGRPKRLNQDTQCERDAILSAALNNTGDAGDGFTRPSHNGMSLSGLVDFSNHNISCVLETLLTCYIPFSNPRSLSTPGEHNEGVRREATLLAALDCNIKVRNWLSTQIPCLFQKSCKRFGL